MSKRSVPIPVFVLALATLWYLGLIPGCNPNLVQIGNGGYERIE